ncbi:MAG TPA: superoxide dismutase [Stellaceae bacterium]|jgi:Fe-Mn family superoxide dismutase|nr:superoxide dismutase [Stellaceae bacterium]
MAFELPPLPYPTNALEPYTSARTLEFHHGKHHQTYVTTLNKLVEGTPMARMPLEEVIRTTYKDEAKTKVFNNAAQVWNHTFFWNSMKPKGGGAPSGDIAKAIERDLGGVDKFEEEFKKAAVDQFGSGWAWLVVDKGKLKISHTLNGVDPLALGQTALLACDVWEHAYYLDYQNRRPDFVQAFLDHLVNWDFAAQNLAKATPSK